MIGYIDNMLRHLFLSRIDQLTDESQVRFQPPDDDWVSYVTNLNVDGEPVNALNVYLFEIRENAQLRSNRRTQTTSEGLVREYIAPNRLDCHYFVSAWSPADNTGAVEPSVDEHELMFEATAVLTREGSLQPTQVYAPNAVPLGFPEVIVDAHLPTAVAPSEGFAKIPEFWSSMAQSWRPGIHLIITIPIIQLPKVLGPIVTARIATFRTMESTDTFDTVIAIGGSIVDGTHLDSDGQPTPLANVPVYLNNSVGEVLKNTSSDENGHFIFGSLRSGSYQLVARVTGRGEFTKNVLVPAQDGEYNLTVL
jgi:Pvc16 N-terminal domain/Carboxypeptidase regulatory-like domain